MSAEYRHRLPESIQKPRLGMEASADKASTFIRTGDKAFRCGRHLQAIYAYQESLDSLHHFYGLREPQLLDGRTLVGETLIEIFVKLFNRQRAQRIRLEIRRKTLEITRFAQTGANMLDKPARAGVDDAVNQFSNFRSFNVSITPDCRTRLRLDVQLDTIDDFESETCMKKALRTLRASIKDDNNRFSYMNQLAFGHWDDCILGI